MEKESVKKFDLEAAFKALDEIEIPQTKGIKANRVDLKERFGHKPATETLVEDYYDVSSTEDLKDAKEERDGEVAKAKLARIEKIVDLNAESPEDLLPSYVGKVIMQCPQCMTLFYKNPEDIEPSDENPDVVNLNEPCQHCGNTSGYTLIGKVGAVSEDEADKYDETPAEENELDLDFDKGTEEVDAEGTGEGAKEMSDEETKEESSDETSSDEDLDLDLNLDEVPEEEPEEEKKEESLNLSKEASEDESEHKSENLTLNEEVDKDLDEKLKAHNDYIAYLQQMIKQEEEALKKAENDEIKAAIQRRLDAFTADLDAALPDAVKAEAPVEETAEEPVEEETKTEEEKVEEPAEETAEEKAEEEASVDEALTEEAKECKVVLSDKPEKEVFAGTKEECEKIIEKNKETKTAKEHGLKIVEPAADENKTEEKSEKSALKESVESEIDSIIASWGVKESLTEEGDLDRLLDSDEFKTPVSEEEINAARREVAKESLKEEKEDESGDESMAPTIYNLFLDSKEVYESESIPLNKALSEITAYIKKLTPEQKKSFSLSWEFDESGYYDKPIYDNKGNIVGSRNDWEEIQGDVIVGVYSEAECKEYGYTFPEDRLVVNVDYAGDAIRKALDDEESKEVEIEEPEFNEDDIDELDECSLNKHIDEYLKEVYSNVKSYKTTDCSLKEGKLIVEGKISFNSGKEKLTMFEFLPAYCEGNLFFEGYNKDFSEDKAFTLNCSINEAKTLITESFGYKYKINENLVEGLK